MLSDPSCQFDDRLRREIAARCSAFRRIDRTPSGGASLKRAAVAITIVPDDDGLASFLLTRRAGTLRSHKGQWALPGGRCDGGETPVEAALRELHEELGLSLDPGDVLGQLDDYPTRSGYLITPLVLWAATQAPVVPNAAEVASVHTISVAQIAQEDSVKFETSPETGRRLVRVLMGSSWVNAPTAAIVYQFRDMLAGRETRVAELEQPAFAWR